MSPVISAEVPTDVKDEIDEYREDGESRSAAVRRLIRAGLEAEKDNTNDRLDPFIYGAMAAGGVGVLLGLGGRGLDTPGLVFAAALFLGAIALGIYDGRFF